ncbi:MAG: hypothetical protein GF355_13235, partial [Candidatus Eisenbacteria bacterium]|nr:hypothetical protein [Candidatus Eisenbacteria bacterium]
MRRSAGLILVLAGLLAMAGEAGAQWPMGVIAEDCTATWCGYCPYAYQGLEVMKEKYDSTEFNSIRYYATSGGYGTSETDARIAYYNIGGYPTVIFRGTTVVVGGSPTIATGSVYDPIVSNGIASPSSFKITVNSVDLTDPGHIDFDVEVMETVDDIGNMKIRVVLLENDLTSTHTDVTRDVLPDVNLTVSQLGEVQNVYHNLDIDPAWVNDKWVAVFIQDDDDKSILQSASTRPAPDYSVRFWAKGSRGAVVGSDKSLVEFEEFAVYNLGTNPDVIRVTLDTGELPAGWSCEFSDGGNVYTDYVDLSLNPGESQTFTLSVTADGPGYAQPRIVLTSNNLPDVEREIRYNVVTNDVDIFFVDDDGAEPYEDYHIDAIENYGGLSYGVWDRDVAGLSAAELTQFDMVFWQTGLSYPSLDANDRDALTPFLEGGGSLFITGQDLGWDIWDQGGSAILWYRQYLHATYLIDNTNRDYVVGRANDPIGDGLYLTLIGGDGADNNEYPDGISPYDDSASPIMSYENSSYVAGIKANSPIGEVVYLGFAYETINNADDRRLLTARIIDWFLNTTDAPEHEITIAQPTVRVFPNPAQGSATLSYALPQAGRAQLRIYAPDGSLVRTL